MQVEPTTRQPDDLSRYETFPILDPVADDQVPGYWSKDHLAWLAKQEHWYRLEGMDSVRRGLLWPFAVFQGLHRPKDLDKAPGMAGRWKRCYTCKPKDRFSGPGDRSVPTPIDRVLLVFVSELNVVYNRRWETADVEEPKLPLGWSVGAPDDGHRFEERLL